jgi:alpha-glucosidase
MTGTAAGWLRGAALYQIYPLSFLDSDGDGWGDLDGVRLALDHVASLGVDGVWICPFYPSPLADFGYDVADHCDVDPRMGGLAAFDRLLDAAHQRGLKVMIDLVCGHTSQAHAWFAASRRSRTGPYADWYVWANPGRDGSPPNNWLSVFGGPAWTWEPRRRQYYLHHFLPSQPALDLRHGPALDAVLDVARFWLERGVDGFRIDAVDFLAHDGALRPNPAIRWREAEPPVKPFALQRHLHDMLHPDIRHIVERLRAVADAYPGRVLLGELSSQPGASARIAAMTAPGGLDAAYTLALAKHGFAAEAFAEALSATDRPEAVCWSLSNHDVERAVSRWRPPGADPERVNALLAMLLVCLPGTICLFQGEELALPQADLAHDQLRDPFGLAFWPEFPGRDGARTPMPWRASAAHGGFTAALAEPWLPVPEAHRRHAVDVQERRAGSPLDIWRHALALRHRLPALARGGVTGIAALGPVLSFQRTVPAGEGGRPLLAVFNLADAPAEVPAPRGVALAPLEVPRPPGVPAAEVVADGRALMLPPLSVFLAEVGAGVGR